MARVALIGVPPRAHLRRMLTHLGDLGYTVVTLDAMPVDVFAGAVEAHLTVPALQREPVVSALGEYHRERAIDGIALFQELTVELSTRVAAALGLPHFPLDRIGACANKLRMRRWMAECGVRCPPFTGVSTLAEARAAGREIGYPAVIKPVRGGASYGVTRLDHEQDLERFFRGLDIFWEPREFVIERYLSGPEVSVETISEDGGRHTHLAVFDKPQPLDGPFFLEETLITTGGLDPAQLSAARGAVSEMICRLGLERCITHTELRLTPDGPVVLEFGLRPIGWPGPLCVAASCGVDLVAAMASIACGKPVDAVPHDGHTVAGWRYLTVSTPGTVSGLPDPAHISGDIIDASIWVRVGDRVGVPPADFNYIKGFLAAKGPTVHSVAATLSHPGWVVSTTS